MTEITITSMDCVKIKDNIVFINSGYRTDNIIPISSINFIREVTRQTEKRTDRTEDNEYCLTILINDHILIRTQDYKEAEKEPHQTLLYGVYDKLIQAMTDYHTSAYRINKPAKVRISDEKES